MTKLKPSRPATVATTPKPPPPPRPTNERSLRPGAPRDGHDIAVELRRLAPLARLAIQGGPGRSPDLPTLKAVHAAIVDLEAAVARLGLNGLGDYVASLRRRVESAIWFASNSH